MPNDNWNNGSETLLAGEGDEGDGWNASEGGRCDDDCKYALLALDTIGLEASAYGSLGSNSRRQAFKQALRRAVEANRIGFVNANLARIDSKPVWLVTINHPWTGIMKYRVPFPQTIDPYSKMDLNEVIDRLLAAIVPPSQARSA